MKQLANFEHDSLRWTSSEFRTKVFEEALSLQVPIVPFGSFAKRDAQAGLPVDVEHVHIEQGEVLGLASDFISIYNLFDGMGVVILRSDNAEGAGCDTIDDAGPTE